MGSGTEPPSVPLAGGVQRNLRTLLMASALVEICTGILLFAFPALLLPLLIGPVAGSTELSAARLAGIALFCLGLACWPGLVRHSLASPPVRAMLAYNGTAALFLAVLAASNQPAPPLIWPAVLLHAAVAGLLAWFGAAGGRADAASDK